MPDQLADALKPEARRRSLPASAITRDALAEDLDVGVHGDRRELDLQLSAAAALRHRTRHGRTARAGVGLECWRSVTPDRCIRSLTDDEACRAVLSRGDPRLVVPALVVAEATYFVGRRLGAAAHAAFLLGLGSLDVEGPAREDFERISELVKQYANSPRWLIPRG